MPSEKDTKNRKRKAGYEVRRESDARKGEQVRWTHASSINRSILRLHRLRRRSSSPFSLAVLFLFGLNLRSNVQIMTDLAGFVKLPNRVLDLMRDVTFSSA